MPLSLWKFRPSALTSAVNAFTSGFSRYELTGCYESDNQRAIRDGVEILPMGAQSKLRTLQWNINSGWHNSRVHSGAAVQRGIIDAIRRADADVVVLNEYCSGRFTRLESCEEDLKALGYSSVTCAGVDYPTVIATRLRVTERKEVRLSFDRSALLVRVESNDGTLVWVIGTHLNHENGKRRHEEMQNLLRELDLMSLLGGAGAGERTLLVGDLNQQHECDYARDEWVRIRSGMEDRDSCQDDGVAKLLGDNGFVCAWDQDATPPAFRTNWDTSRPPATHWSGTIVDYSYGSPGISPVTVSISPSGWSDHRMTVCDWTWQ
mmetsp:Transcript_20494/g.43973  ORF Transcript_20494/g.43973 Transcript_20494/m.43973 type:complete len:320 (+) Transcript_20494:17-976(+)